jgi:DNA-binding transcriptional MerR regulator
MRIGELARATGVHVQTIRFYERRGLLPSPSRSSGGYRDYRGDAVPLVQFIKRVQAHGYTLEEIRELLALSEHGTHVAATVRDRAKSKVQQLEAEIVRLSGLRDWLKQFISDSERGVVPPDCLVLRRSVTGAEREPYPSFSTIASQTRSACDSATGSQRQSQRVARVRADHRPPRLRRDRV